jgi:hypothetical protein
MTYSNAIATAIVACGTLTALCAGSHAQDLAPPPVAESVGGEAGPMSYGGGGSFYSQQLGAHLRVRYNTESYGQNEGNLNIGSMKLFDMGDSAAFIDGQVTLNDTDGMGYNIGGGYRWLATPRFSAIDPEPMRLMGISLWADGQNTDDQNFFPQIGVSLEALGETTDIRGNLYVPLGDRVQEGDTVSLGTIGFIGNSLSQQTLTDVDNALTVAEIELARRLGDREAWAFVGGYTLAGDDFDTGGVKVGVRGYALPDLFLQFAVTNDDLFDTNAVFSLGWFIGRTRTNHVATGTLADRLREPVLRNDYVAVYRSQRTGGQALTDVAGDELRIVHVNSNAVGSTNEGTFENPYTTLGVLDDANESQPGDVILVHSGSTYTDDSATLQANQRLLGEGNNIAHTVNTSQLGVFTLPETTAGAGAGAVPVIAQTGAGTSITLADANEVNNFSITGGTIGIDGTNSAGDPTLRNLDISNTTGDGISLLSFARPDPNDVDNDGNTTEVAFNVTIDTVDFNNIGGNAITLDGNSGANLADPLVDLNEDILISNVNVTGGSGFGVAASNTNDGGVLEINTLAYNGNATGAGGVSLNNANGNTGVLNSSFTGGTAGAVGVSTSASEGQLTVTDTNTFSNVTGSALVVAGGTPTVNFNADITNAAEDAVRIDGITGGTINVRGDIANTGARSILVQNNTGGSVTFLGDVTDTGQGINVSNNTGGSTLFAGTYDLDTAGNTAVTAINNTGATVDFNDLDINTTSGTGFLASGGGTIGIGAGGSTVTTTTGTGVNMNGVTIATGGAVFDSVTVNGATNGVVATNLTGGQLRVGTAGGAAASGGTMTTTGDAIAITNATNVQINRVTIDNAGGNGVAIVHNNTAENNVRLNGLVITAATLDAIDATADGSGRFDLEVDNSTLGQSFQLAANGSGVVALVFEDSTITTGNNDIAMDIDLAAYSSAEIDIQRNTITTIDNTAFRFNADNPAINTVNFRLADNMFTNNSAASPTADIDAGGGTTLNSTILDNDFNNNGGGPQFTMDSNATSLIRLSLLQNRANNAAGTYQLEENASGDFRLFDLADTFADLNNDGNVTSSNELNFTNDPGNIPTPNP